MEKINTTPEFIEYFFTFDMHLTNLMLSMEGSQYQNKK